MRTSATVIGICLLVLGTPSAFGQRAEALVRQHRYTEAIDALRGDGASLDDLSDGDLSTLGVAHLQRAYFLRDLAALHVEIGRAYYHLRLTRDDFAPSPWTAYFLGRHLFEQGRAEPALSHFNAAAADPHLPGAYRRRARLWAAACQARLGRTQQAAAAWAALADEEGMLPAGERAYARWKVGLAETPACEPGRDAPDAVRCRLWAAVQQRDAEILFPLQQRLLADAAPDREVLVEGDVTLRFYDPAVLDILAVADFVAAMEAFRRYRGAQGLPDALLYAGVSAYEAGFFDEARTFLEATDHPLRLVYLGALDERTGRREAAAQQWARARSGEAGLEIEWADVASRFETEHNGVRVAANKHRRTAVSNRRAAHKLGRALLRIGRPAEALSLLEAAAPATGTASLEPGFATTLAHARFLAGRAYYPAVRSHLASLIAAYPLAERVLYLAQAYTAPERSSSFNKRTGQ